MLAQGRGREDVLFWQGNRIPGIHSLLPGHSREIQAIIRGKKVWGLDLRTAVSWCQVGLWSEGQFGLRALLQWKKKKIKKREIFFCLVQFLMMLLGTILTLVQVPLAFSHGWEQLGERNPSAL